MNTVKSISAYDLMAPAVTTAESTPLKDLYSIMDHQKVSHIIVTHEGILKGIISKEDIMRRMLSLVSHSSGKTYGEMQLEVVKAKNIMTSAVVKVTANEDWSDIVQKFRDFQFHCLPVVDAANRPVGIITPLQLLVHYTTQK
jgi:CBS domain-containing protein